MSKFVVMPGPQFYPGKTICCGKTTGPVVDFGVVEEFGPRDGAVYFCVDCIVEAAMQTHKVVLASDVPLNSLTTDQLEEVRETVGRLHAVFADGNTIADRLGSLTSSLDSVSFDKRVSEDNPGESTIPDFPAFDSDEFALGEGPVSVPADSSDDKSVPAFGL